jgi:alkaline phosphatase
MMKGMKKTIGGLVVGTMILVASHAMAADPAKNVILMISDGMGFNTMKATDFYTGAPAVYESFTVKGSMNTSSAGASGGYVGAPYDPTKMWSNFNYQKSGATDSASAATAMYTGVKNYDNQINKTTTGADLTTFFETASTRGKATGAVSTVNFDHATPAAVVAKTTTRNDYATITSQMINSGLDVIMGAGHPLYNNNGQAVAANYGIVGNQANWTAITGGANGRTFIETKSDFEKLADGTLSVNKVFGVAQVRDTIQDSRTGAPGSPFNSNVPDLTTMTKAALNVLDNHTTGFAVMIEGGAVDWANHANGLRRSIDEQIDFNRSVEYVVEYLNANTNGNNWNNTLLIVTADHETGALWGPTAGIFNQVLDFGAGSLPGAAYNSGSHTNALVPFFAKGADAGLFNTYLTGSDPEMENKYGIDLAFNRYIDNTDIFKVMSAAQNTAVPEPSVIWMLGFGIMGLAAFQWREAA